MADFNLSTDSVDKIVAMLLEARIPRLLVGSFLNYLPKRKAKVTLGRTMNAEQRARVSEMIGVHELHFEEICAAFYVCGQSPLNMDAETLAQLFLADQWPEGSGDDNTVEVGFLAFQSMRPVRPAVCIFPE